MMRYHTNELGEVKCFTFDSLHRLLSTYYPSDGTYASNSYTLQSGYNATGGTGLLDVTGTRDRLGRWTQYYYNGVRQIVMDVDPLNRTNLYSYCGCGSMEYHINALQHTNVFNYDLRGLKTDVFYTTNKSEHFGYNALGQMTTTSDNLNVTIYFYNNQGLLTCVSNSAFGTQRQITYDIYDRVYTDSDATGVTMTYSYDRMGRVTQKSYSNGTSESYAYSAFGMTNHVDQLNKATRYLYDALGRKTNEVNANSETIKYTYNAAGSLLTLKDGKNQQTSWAYNQFNQVTNKADNGGTTMFRYLYDPNGRLTNRWTPAFGATTCRYDAVGNLTNVDYLSSTDINLAYDALNRVTNQVDAAGTTRYTFTDDGQLFTEDGPFTSDTLTNLYHSSVPGLRIGFSLQQSSGTWTNGFGYDAARRLTNVTSPAGAFSYQYVGASRLVGKILEPSNAYITNYYDSFSRLTNTSLKTSGNLVSNYHAYVYNDGNQRTKQTRFDGSYVNYTYDNIGQLQSAKGYTTNGTAITTEQMGYKYDAAWNLSGRTNNGTVTTWSINSLNQLPASPYGTWTYDSNGNLYTDGTVYYGYDSENQLIWIDQTSYQRVEFTYDARGRMKIRKNYTWSSSGWSLAQTVNYIHDGMLVVQERVASALVSYTRGVDMSGSFQGAGGIGGLLSRSASRQSCLLSC